jgi:hypothetical protein
MRPIFVGQIIDEGIWILEYRIDEWLMRLLSTETKKEQVCGVEGFCWRNVAFITDSDIFQN